MDQISHGKKLCIQTDQLWLIMPTCQKYFLKIPYHPIFPHFVCSNCAKNSRQTFNRHPPSEKSAKMTPFLETKKPLSGFEKVVDSLETFDLMQGDEVNSAGRRGGNFIGFNSPRRLDSGWCLGWESWVSLTSWKTNGRPLKINGWKMYFLLK